MELEANFYTRFDVRHGTPQGWTSYIHPQGWVYFRNDQYRVVTDEDIRIPHVYTRILNSCREEAFGEIPEGSEVHLLSEPQYSLFVNHRERVATYDVNSSHLPEDGSLQYSTSTLARWRRMYWTYVQNHPVHIRLPKQARSEARDAIQAFLTREPFLERCRDLHSCVRFMAPCTEHIMLGTRNIAPFSKDECQDLLRTLSSFEESSGTDLPSYTEFVAWFLRQLYIFRREATHARFTLREFNEKNYLVPQQPKLKDGPTIARRFSALLVNGPFFGIPWTYLSHAIKASEFTGRLSGLQDAWKTYTKQLAREYSDFVLAATVLLSATVGFLAVPDIASHTRAVGTVSVFASLGSIMSGIFFVWRHRQQLSSSNTLAYIHNARHNPFGLMGHALLLSLPPVFLVWSVLTFTAALILYTTQGPHSVSDGTEIAVILAFFAVVLLLLLFGLYTFSHIWTWKGKSKAVVAE